MTNDRTGTIALLVAVLTAISLPATARDGALTPSVIDRGTISVEHMPPIMRAAYLKGIRDELIAHGYDPGPDNGAYDGYFSTAIRSYQSDAGLRPDGAASKELLDHLLFALPKIYADGSRGVPALVTAPAATRIALAPPARRQRHPAEEPIPSPAPRGRVSAKPLPDANAAASRAMPRLNTRLGTRAPLSLGNGGFVSRTQRALRDRGYYGGPIDGRFSDGLSSAIRAFQKSNRLPVTGVIDGSLLKALS